MKKAININLLEENDYPKYIFNALGEEARYPMEATEESLKWYNDLKLHNMEWLTYLVKIKDQIGLLILLEIPHCDCEDYITGEMDVNSDWYKSSSDTIFSHVEKVMEEAGEKIDFEVLVGNGTGFGGTHEVCVFFPVGTSTETMENTMKFISTDRLFSFDK